MPARFRPIATYASGRPATLVHGPFRNRDERRAMYLNMPRAQRSAIAGLLNVAPARQLPTAADVGIDDSAFGYTWGEDAPLNHEQRLWARY